jgi:hypothetical protein
VATAVLARVKALEGQIIPDGVHVTATRNYGVTANDKAMKLIQNYTLYFPSFASMVCCV